MRRLYVDARRWLEAADALVIATIDEPEFVVGELHVSRNLYALRFLVEQYKKMVAAIEDPARVDEFLTPVEDAFSPVDWHGFDLDSWRKK